MAATALRLLGRLSPTSTSASASGLRRLASAALRGGSGAEFLRSPARASGLALRRALPPKATDAQGVFGGIGGQRRAATEAEGAGAGGAVSSRQRTPRGEAGEETLSSSSTVNVGSLGGAIAHRLRKHGRVVVRSIGDKAAYNGVKAAVSAGDYLAQDPGAPQDKVVALRVFEKTESMRASSSANGGGDDSDEQMVNRTVLHLEAQWRRKPPAASNVRSLVIGASTNAGRAAAAVAGALRAEEAAEVRAMGAAAIHRALVAAAMAQRYLDSDGKGVELVVIPRFEIQAADARSGGGPRDKGEMRQLVIAVERLQG